MVQRQRLTDDVCSIGCSRRAGDRQVDPDPCLLPSLEKFVRSSVRSLNGVGHQTILYVGLGGTLRESIGEAKSAFHALAP